MIQLFDEKVRTNSGPALLNGDTYNAYNDSADPDISSIRNFNSNWFDHFPEQEKEDLKSLF